RLLQTVCCLLLTAHCSLLSRPVSTTAKTFRRSSYSSQWYKPGPRHSLLPPFSPIHSTILPQAAARRARLCLPLDGAVQLDAVRTGCTSCELKRRVEGCRRRTVSSQ